MKFPLSKRIAVISAAALAIGSAGGVFAITRTDSPPKTQPGSTQTRANAAQSSTAADAIPLTAAKNTGGNQAASDDGSPKAASTPACKALPLAAAAELLGPDAKSMTPAGTAAFKAGDTSVSACAYASGSATVQLIARAPQNTLGVSRNAVIFGSGKPADAVTLQGYGQAAYWDTGAKQLNILANNIWYAITRSSGSQADTEAAAKVVVGL